MLGRVRIARADEHQWRAGGRRGTLDVGPTLCAPDPGLAAPLPKAPVGLQQHVQALVPLQDPDEQDEGLRRQSVEEALVGRRERAGRRCTHRDDVRDPLEDRLTSPRHLAAGRGARSSRRIG